jgi:hypothetical protein
MSNRFSKKIFVIFFAFFLSLSPVAARNAFAWDAVAGALYHRALDTVVDTIKGIQLGLLKKQAYEALNKEVNFLVTGRSSQGALFVTDWRDYLINQPQQRSKLFINAYIDQTIGGRGSITNYIPANSEGFGLNAANYNNQLKVGAAASIVNPTAPKVTYVGNPSQMFSQGNFRNLSLYLSGINNPWSFNLHIQEKLDESKQQEQQIALQKSSSSGMLGKEVDGKIVTPSAVIENAVTGVQNLGNQIIAAAQSIPEVISSVVSQTITQSLSQGIGTIQASVHKEVGGVRMQVTGQMNAAIGQLGPGAQYADKWALGAQSGTNVGAVPATCNARCSGSFRTTCNSNEFGLSACPGVPGKEKCCIKGPGN